MSWFGHVLEVLAIGWLALLGVVVLALLVAVFLEIEGWRDR